MTQVFDPVVVGVGDSSFCRATGMFAATEAVRIGVGLRMVRTYEPPSPYTAKLVDAARLRSRLAAENAVLRHEVEHIRHAYPALRVEGTLVFGPAWAAMVHQSRHASLCVIGSHQPGHIPCTIGRSVATYAHCPVIVVPAETINPDEVSHGPVVAGISHGTDAAAVLEFAFAHAESRKVPLMAVQCWIRADLDGHHHRFDEAAYAVDQALAAMLRPVAARYPHTPVLRLPIRTPRPAHTLRTFAQDAHASLLVLGAPASPEGSAEPRLGLVAADILRRTQIPVAVVRCVADANSTTDLITTGAPA